MGEVLWKIMLKTLTVKDEEGAWGCCVSVQTVEAMLHNDQGMVTEVTERWCHVWAVGHSVWANLMHSFIISDNIWEMQQCCTRASVVIEKDPSVASLSCSTEFPFSAAI